jgi:hypothetical protein
MLIMHGSLDVWSIPAGFVDNLGTISSSNAGVSNVFQQNAGHTVFYSASACVWMYLQQLASRNFSSAGSRTAPGAFAMCTPPPDSFAGVLPSCKAVIDIDWDVGDDSKFPSNRFWTCAVMPACLFATDEFDCSYMIGTWPLADVVSKDLGHVSPMCVLLHSSSIALFALTYE